MNTAARAFVAACRAEIEAPKPGNVHVFAGGHDMEAQDFLVSAELAALPLTQPGGSLGQRVTGAVDVTMAAIGTNTNLGIILLCTPLIMAFERLGAKASAHPKFRQSLEEVLDSLDVADSEQVFRAIRQANPGGMGKVEGSDLQRTPQRPLRQIMAEARLRDRIARAYADGYADIFDLGIPTLARSRREGREAWWPATATYLAFLSAFPDTHIVRKWGEAQAAWVLQEADTICHRIRTTSDRLGLLLGFDREIKARGLNPGTSADLTVATLFAESLICILRRGPESG